MAVSRMREDTLPDAVEEFMRMSRHLGRIEISTELLEQWMALPEGSTIRRVSDANTIRSLFFDVVVEHPDLPEVAEGNEIPLIDYTASREVIAGTFHRDDAS